MDRMKAKTVFGKLATPIATGVSVAIAVLVTVLNNVDVGKIQAVTEYNDDSVRKDAAVNVGGIKSDRVSDTNRASRVAALRHDLASTDPLKVLQAVREAGAERLRELETDVERVLLSGSPRTHVEPSLIDYECLETLRSFRGDSAAAAAAVRYLDVLTDPGRATLYDIRTRMYLHIALADVDAPTTLASLLARRLDDRDGASILNAMSHHPSRACARWLLNCYDQADSEAIRASALSAIAELSMTPQLPDDGRNKAIVQRPVYVFGEVTNAIIEKRYNDKISPENRLDEAEREALRDFVLKQARSPHEAVRKTVAEKVVAFGAETAMPVLTQMADEDSSPEVRSFAREVLQAFVRFTSSVR